MCYYLHTGQRVVNNTFYKLICEGKVYNNGIKLYENDGIFLFTYMKNDVFFNLPLSSMNGSEDDIYSSDYIRNSRFDGCCTEPNQTY